MVDRGILYAAKRLCGEKKGRMSMKVNGEERAVPTEGTVLSLLRELGHDPQRVAVEKNGSIVPRAAFAEEKLADADHLEVVCFVGGG